MQLICLFQYRWTAVSTKPPFSPVTRLPMKMNSCYPNSSLPPGDYWHWSLISLHVHHAYFNKAQNIWVLFYSNPPGGAGNFPIPSESVDAMTWLNCLCFGGFFASDFCGIFSAYIWRIFLSSFLLHIFTFSLILNGFNIGQVKSGTIWQASADSWDKTFSHWKPASISLVET